MTTPSTAEAFTNRLPTDSERAVAGQLREIVAASMASGPDAPKLRLQKEDGENLTITLTPTISGVLLDLLRHIARGESVTLVPLGEMLTTQQAADILNVSRPHLIGLITKNDIPCTLVGRHRRIRAKDLFDYKDKRDERRSSALDDLAGIDSDDL